MASDRRFERSDNENDRLAAVQKYASLDMPLKAFCDHILALLGRVFNCSMCAISMVEADRIRFICRYGFTFMEVGREPGFCASAILGSGPWVVENAKKDRRTLANPLVLGDVGVQFYIGMPLTTNDGLNVGTLCVFDTLPRTVSDDEIEILARFAAVIIDYFDQHVAALDAFHQMRKALDVARILVKEVDHRVMNNLQLLTSMMNLQAAQLPHSISAEEIKRASGRIAAIGRVHQQLHMEENGESKSIATYLMALCTDLSTIFLNGPYIEAKSIESRVDLTRLTRVGLIVNELVTNAIKKGARRIGVSVAQGPDGSHVLCVEDDGIGLPQGFDVAQATGFGLTMVLTLVKGLGGKLAATSSGLGTGACFSVTFSI